MALAVKPRWSLMFPAPLDTVSREMDQMFDHLFQGGGQSAWHAPASLWEEEGRWCLEVELPGVKQDDVEVTLEKNSLRIAAQRNAPEDRKYFHQERVYGRIERLITLPETVNPDSIEAELKDGVLYLQLAKRPESQPRRIAVKTN